MSVLTHLCSRVLVLACAPPPSSPHRMGGREGDLSAYQLYRGLSFELIDSDGTTIDPTASDGESPPRANAALSAMTNLPRGLDECPLTAHPPPACVCSCVEGEGELVLLGAQCATPGYIGSAQLLSGDPAVRTCERLRTGDLFRLCGRDADGRPWLRHLCRADDLIVHRCVGWSRSTDLSSTLASSRALC